MQLLRVLVLVTMAAEAAAQGLPAEPISVANGRIVFGGEAFATVAESDPGWFNYTDYEYNALRNVRASLATEVRASRRTQVLAEVRLDHGRRLSAYALFLRLRPWPARQFDIQVGRVPPTFGAFTRTIYAYDNLVIGQPLAYHYLLSLRSTAVPASADDLLAMRARGWLADFPIGNRTPAPGLPVVNTLRYDSGLQLHGVAGRVEWTGAVTAGSLSEPRLIDNNGRPQVAGRLQFRAAPGVRLGASAATGPWLDSSLDDVSAAPRPARRFRQTAVAVDVDLSHGPWVARAEWLRSSWQLPVVDPAASFASPAAQSFIVEGRYRLAPGLSLAARGDALWFSTIDGTTAARPWEANLKRLETAVAYSLTRNVVSKVAWQINRRAGGRIRHDSLLAAQLLYWF